MTLDIPSLTEHIRDWMLEEVQNIATMNEEALQHVFSYMWKFNKRWISFLNPPLPHDLEFLKVSKIKSQLFNKGPPLWLLTGSGYPQKKQEDRFKLN